MGALSIHGTEYGMARTRPAAAQRGVKGRSMGGFSESPARREPGTVNWQSYDPAYLRQAREAQERGMSMHDFAANYQGDPLGCTTDGE